MNQQKRDVASSQCNVTFEFGHVFSWNMHQANLGVCCFKMATYYCLFGIYS